MSNTSLLFGGILNGTSVSVSRMINTGLTLFRWCTVFRIIPVVVIKRGILNRLLVHKRATILGRVITSRSLRFYMYTTILYHIDKHMVDLSRLKNINPLLIREREKSRRFEYLSLLPWIDCTLNTKHRSSIFEAQIIESSIPIRGTNERKRSLFHLPFSRPQKKGKKLVEEPFARFFFPLPRWPSCTLTEFLFPIRRYTFHGEERGTRGNGWRKG